MKKLDQQIKTLREWGYEVNESENDSPVLHIASEFLTLYIRTDDAEALASLTDRDAHIERCQQMLESDEETITRLEGEAKADRGPTRRG